MEYPTLKEVDTATTEQLDAWYKNLSIARTAMERAIMVRIVMKRNGDYKPTVYP
jgi:hypothetical protein